MRRLLRARVRLLVVFSVLMTVALPARADEIWVAPTLQQDAGGLGIGSNTYWPVTMRGLSRFAWGIPNNLQIFQNARTLNVLLLNEVQRQQREIEEARERIAKLEQKLDALLQAIR